VVVGVRNQDVENDAPPEFLEIGLNTRAVLAKNIDNFEVTVRSIVPRPQHAYRGEERDSLRVNAIEPFEQ
jgi:hypothetical protein